MRRSSLARASVLFVASAAIVAGVASAQQPGPASGPPGASRAPRGGGPPPSSSSDRPVEIATLGSFVVDAPAGGALVRSVIPSFPPSFLAPGDVILEVDGRPVRRAADLESVEEATPEGTPMLLRVRRRGAIRLVAIGLRAAPAPRPPAIGGGPPPPASSPPARVPPASSSAPEPGAPGKSPAAPGTPDAGSPSEGPGAPSAPSLHGNPDDAPRP